MNTEHGTNRRDFLKSVAAIGAGGAFAAAVPPVRGEAPPPAGPTPVPMRSFGRTGVKVPVLSLGGIFDVTTNQIVLRQAWAWGVKYWDTAHGYTGGKSEEGMGNYFEKNPEHRKEIFLVTKGSGARDVDGLDERLATSLERLKTDYIDLYFLHGIRRGDQLTPEIKAWAEARKKEGKIRFFGFSTHNSMADCLQAGAKAGWVDGVMTTYNYRLMQEDEMSRAIDACHEAGVGVTAMKTQGGGSVKTDSDAELEMAGHFVRRGFTEGQAKLKAVWEDERIAAICSQMPNTSLLSQNIAASLDRQQLTQADWRALAEADRATCSGYCAGCAELCEPAVAGRPPISDLMRLLMYEKSYAGAEMASEWRAWRVGQDFRGLAALDYSEAERRCPRGLPIGALMREAEARLA